MKSFFRRPQANPRRRISRSDIYDELLRERRKDRVFGLIKLLLALGAGGAYLLLMMFMSPLAPSMAPSGPYAAVVDISGAIGPGKPASYASLAPQLKKA